MKLWLSMIIKNEEKNIKNYLYEIYDLFDDIVIVDTGSTDASLKLLKDIWIQAIPYKINHTDARLIDARNFSIEKNACNRVLILDWDEQISREDLLKIKSMEPDYFQKDVSWYFIKRKDYRYDKPFDDYKMCLINKNHVRFLFNVHACPQVYVRDNNGIWLRLNGITLHHHTEPRAYKLKYIEQLENGIKENPGCLRFYRFLWYYYFKNNKLPKAIEKFEFIIKNRNHRFPVEILNAIMLISSIYQWLWDHIRAFNYISLWQKYYQEVKDDFEVKINFRMEKRFSDTQAKLLEDHNAIIIPYEFAY